MAKPKRKYLIVNMYGEKVSFQIDPNLNEDTKVDFSICRHSVCYGIVDATPVSTTHYALACRSCDLRLVIPNKIDTHKKLKKYLVGIRKKD